MSTLSEPATFSGRTAAPLLAVEGLGVSYGGARAVRDVSFSLAAGECVAIVGTNGAGKTSILRALSGLEKHDGNPSIKLDGRDISRLRPHEVVAAGLVQVPEGRGVIGNLSVRENLLMGGFLVSEHETAERLDRVHELFPVLRDRAAQSAGLLSGGEQQMLAIGRALIAGPKVLMVDEPSMGLAPVIVSEVLRKFEDVRRLGTGILLIEQNLGLALDLADRIYVLVHGSIVMEGVPGELDRSTLADALAL